MSKGKHTPGPWETGEKGADFGVLAWSEEEKAEDFVAFVPDLFGPKAREANARLIAAAPDLLEATKRALTFLRDNGLIGPREALEAAIAKAEP